MDLEGLIVFGSREGAFPAPFAMDNFFTNDRPGAIVVFPRDGEPRVLAFALAANDHMQAMERNEAVWIRPENFYAGAPNGKLLVAADTGGRHRPATHRRDRARPLSRLLLRRRDALPHVEDRARYVSQGHVRAGRQRFYELTASRSAEELEVLKWSADVGEAMSMAMRDATRPGVTEGEIYSAIVAACPKHVGFTAEILLRSGKDFIRLRPAKLELPSSDTPCDRGRRYRHRGDLLVSRHARDASTSSPLRWATCIEDYERAAEVARASYEAGLDALRPGRTFGEVVEAMQAPLKKAGGYNIHPLIHSINPFGLVCGFGEGFNRLEGADRYALVAEVPMFGADVEMRAGMCFSFEPSCMFGRRYVNLGGTVVCGEDKAIELNSVTTHMMRV